MQLLFHFDTLIFITDSPEFVTRPMDVSGETGEEVVLTCLADANPAPSYKWFRNGNLDLVSSTFQ